MSLHINTSRHCFKNIALILIVKLMKNQSYLYKIQRMCATCCSSTCKPPEIPASNFSFCMLMSCLSSRHFCTNKFKSHDTNKHVFPVIRHDLITTCICNLLALRQLFHKSKIYLLRFNVTEILFELFKKYESQNSLWAEPRESR